MRASTLKLIFGKVPAFQHNRGTIFDEVESIFHTKPTVNSNYNGEFQGNDFQRSVFWKALVVRFWQYDDFAFPGAAAASFMGNAHTFKIWFNPLESYKLMMIAAMGLYDDSLVKTAQKRAEDAKKSSKKKNKGKSEPVKTIADEEEVAKRAAEAEKAENEWDLLTKGKSKHSAKLTQNYGWDQALWREMEKSEKQGSWTELGWYLWNNAITNSVYINRCVVAIMIHEMMHILWHHIGRTGKRIHGQFNLATDYAINQCVDFPPEMLKVLIAKENETFYSRFVISYARHKIINEIDLRKKAKKKFGLSHDMSVQDFVQVAFPRVEALEKEYMLDGSSWHPTNLTDKKSADFYYRILEETMIFQEGEGEGEGQGSGKGNPVRGYDDHNQWDNIAEDERGEGDDEGEADGDDEGDGKDGKEGDEDSDKDGKGNGDEDSADSNGDGSQPKPKQEGGKVDQVRKESKGGKASKSKGDSSSGGATTKERGRGEGVGAAHGGWDVTSACARQEAKGVVRDSMKRAGFNPDDPNEVERCLNRTPGMESLGAYIHDWFKVRTKSWKDILAKYVATAINPQELDYTMSRENRRIAGMFPGKRRERGIDLIVAIDTSGSISYADYNDFVNQIEKIVRDCDVNKVRMIQCHHSIAFDKMVRLRSIKNIPVVETGGTTMQVIYKKLKNENNRKLLILFTDGCIDHFKNEGWGFKSIMFLSRGNRGYADALIERGFKVICQDEE
jgi:predicted metal-dependent peptidase